MYLSKTFKISIYDAHVQFIITKNITKTVNRIHAYHKSGTVWGKDETAAGCTILCSTVKYYIVINSEYLTHNTICHELYHCVCTMANDRGIHEEESRAWLQGIIAEEIYKYLKEKNIEVA